jgi:hypothetical protein
MIKDTDLSWCAGFFDGEGYIIIVKSKDSKHIAGVRHWLRIGINHVRPEPLQEIQKILGGSLRFDEKVYGKRFPRYVWTTSTADAARVLNLLLPYLKNKHLEAKLALEFQETIGNTGQRILPGVINKREEIRGKVLKLNLYG